MKKHISLVLAIAMLATLALTACGGSSDTTSAAPGSSDTPAQSTNTTTADDGEPAATTGNENPSTTTQPDDYSPIPDDTFSAQFRKYEIIDNIDAYKADHVNLTALYFDGIDGQSVTVGHDWSQDEDEEVASRGNQSAANIFDCNPETKWCCARADVEEGKSALIWKMSQPVYVTAYSLTTGDDNHEWPSRNPVQWRLYACSELPAALITDDDPNGGGTYLENQTVPDGWTLIDAMDASDPADGVSSQLPDEQYKEVGFELKEAGTYQYFMFIIDYVELEDTTFQLGDLTLYGTDN